ncbi:LppA family lipoprotein [Crossiella equi]|uniref:LppA family lipoprotein n=1 Tax=Crossiella equi TaxID=130796 RepID=UPI000A396B52|nr:LppA family lipoprotein [Crossiella equi]
MVILSGALVLGGCTTTPEGNNVNEMFQQLRQRPDIDEASKRYTELQSKIKDRLAAEFPSLAWEIFTGTKGASACGFDFPGLDAADGENRGLPGWKAKGNLPDTDWEKALQSVREVAAQHGFSSPAPIVDKPGDHEVIFKDSYDAKLSFGTAANTLLSLRTGCHLTVEAHRRGTPASE